MTENDSDQKAIKAVEIANVLLGFLEKMEIEPNIAQAALGDAWLRLLSALGWTRHGVLEMTKEAIDITWDGKDEK
jgi:hypothetical protein